MRILITGATGMVGSDVLKQALKDEAISEVTVISRKPISITNAKMKVILHQDFMNYDGLENVFKNIDACLWCLGISQNAVKEEEYIRITYDYTVAAAKAMRAANTQITFMFLSGDGANSEEKGRMLFGRIKGKTENELLRMSFNQLYIARPAAILPVNSSATFIMALRIQYMIVGLLRYIMPGYVITSVNLARTLLFIVKQQSTKVLYDYKEIKQLSKQFKD